MMKWPFVILGFALLLVLWVGWEIAAQRDENEHAQRERKRNPLQGALESHLAIWLFMLVLVWVVAEEDLPLWWACLSGGTVAAGTLWWAGYRFGAGRSFPSALRWLLAPIHGVSLWFVLLANLMRRRFVDRNPEVGSSDTRGVESIQRAVFELDSLTLSEVLVPHSQITALQADDSVEDALIQAKQGPHNLYPVFGSSVDQPLGVVRLTDLSRPGISGRPVREFAITVPIVPETMTGVSLLGQLAAAPIACALVVDEFGSLAGLVTMEDLVEVLLGDLFGEHEIEKKRIVPLEGGVYRVEGLCEIEEFNEQVAEVLPEGEYETVAGLFLDQVGRIPQQGDEVVLSGVSLEVLERTDRQVLWLQITVPSSAVGSSGP